MDKLQPIIKNRFWILAGLVLPMAMYGFFSANAKLKAETESRETALQGALNGVPNGSTDPNKDYAEGLSKINEVYAESVDSSIESIWMKQKELMDWPPVVKRYTPEVFLAEYDYRGIVAYQEAYERLMRDLQSRVEPVMPLDKPKVGGGGVGPMLGGRPGRTQEIADVPWAQKVVLAAQIPQAHFGKMRATSEEIWNAQIDIWMLRLLFDSVKRLNEDKDSVTEAILRRIDRLDLVGGDGSPVLTGGGGGGGDASYGGEMMMAEGGAGGRYGDSGGGYGGGGGRGYGAEGGAAKAKTVPIAFSPAQEFGSDADPEASSGGGDMSGGADMMAAGAGMSNPNAKRLRYIADSEDKPYFERGFYMSVIIMQDKIPDFLVELADSPWPVSVTRFHVGKNPYYTGQRVNPGAYNPSFGAESAGFPEMDDLYAQTSMSASGGENFLGGPGAGMKGIEGVGGLTQNLPAMANDAMQHPNLVQLDLCGVITMYKQPQSIVDALTNPEAAAPADATGGATAEDPATPTEATPENLPADPAAETVPESEPAPAETPEPPAAEPGTPAAENNTDPTEKPAAKPAPLDPANL